MRVLVGATCVVLLIYALPSKIIAATQVLYGPNNAALEEQLRSFALQFLLWNIFGAFALGVDWRAHMGGLVAGAAVTWAIGPRYERKWGPFGGRLVDRPLVDMQRWRKQQ